MFTLLILEFVLMSNSCYIGLIKKHINNPEKQKDLFIEIVEFLVERKNAYVDEVYSTVEELTGMIVGR